VTHDLDTEERFRPLPEPLTAWPHPGLRHTDPEVRLAYYNDFLKWGVIPTPEEHEAWCRLNRVTFDG
jgi:hypothetical protein